MLRCLQLNGVGNWSSVLGDYFRCYIWVQGKGNGLVSSVWSEVDVGRESGGWVLQLSTVHYPVGQG